MLYEFKSKAAGTVVMTEPVAERLLAIVGKAAGPRGIFTVEQTGPAIAALQAAVEREKAEERAADERLRATRHAADDDDEPPVLEATRPVTLAQRAWPLIDLLRTAQKAGHPVTWGA
jgi:hypothetical protein